MLSIKKIALLATVIALAAVPTATLAQPSFNPGPVSIVTNCSNSGDNLMFIGQTQTFELTDVTIANKGSAVTVGIFNNGSIGVQYVVNASSTQTQKFETPIQFKGTANIPFLSCDSTNPNVVVSVQGVMQ
jgi:hypothetical protein